jgi:hypothetical protein
MQRREVMPHSDRARAPVLSLAAGSVVFIVSLLFGGAAYAQGSFGPAASMSTARFVSTATLLPNGKVLVAGGYNDALLYLTSSELYDPSTNTWSAAGALVTPRDAHTATLLPNGKVLVAGGVHFGG